MEQKAWLCIKQTRQILAEGDVGRDFVVIGQHCYINQPALKYPFSDTDLYQRSLLKGSGPVVDLGPKDVPILKKAGIRINTPGIFFLFGKGKILFDLGHPQIKLLILEKSLIANYPKPLYHESEFRFSKSDTSLNATKERILLICQSFMKLAERPGAVFYKDKNDERTWQLVFDPKCSPVDSDWLTLATVNHNQWAYEFLETKEARRRGESSFEEDNYREYLEAIDLDPRNRKCQEPECLQTRIKGSDFCQAHHFEIVTGKKF